MKNKLRLFEIGDVVLLKSGGPKMVVDSFGIISRDVNLIWFNAFDEMRRAMLSASYKPASSTRKQNSAATEIGSGAARGPPQVTERRQGCPATSC